ncbi:MAG: hypothetical protein NTV01_05850 [Bacteroidia bacterium]|nr:hypothetical protein [Bacteroidia bacterium]
MQKTNKSQTPKLKSQTRNCLDKEIVGDHPSAGLDFVLLIFGAYLFFGYCCLELISIM